MYQGHIFKQKKLLIIKFYNKSVWFIENIRLGTLYIWDWITKLFRPKV